MNAMRILKLLAILAVICCTFAATSFAGGPSMNIDFTGMSVARWNGSTSWMPLQNVNGVQSCEVGDVIGLWVTNYATPGKVYTDIQWAQSPVVAPRGSFGTLMNIRTWTASKVGRVDLYSIISETAANGFQSRVLSTPIVVNPKSIAITASLYLGTDGSYTLCTNVYNLGFVSYFAPRIDLQMVGDKINATVFSDRNASVVILGKTGLEVIKGSGRMLCSWKTASEPLEISDLTVSKCSLHLPTIPAGGKITSVIKMAPITALSAVLKDQQGKIFAKDLKGNFVCKVGDIVSVSNSWSPVTPSGITSTSSATDIFVGAGFAHGYKATKIGGGTIMFSSSQASTGRGWSIGIPVIVNPGTPSSYTYEVKPVDSNGIANGAAVLPNALGYRILAVGQHYKVFAHVVGKTDAQINVLMGNRYNGEYPLRTLINISNAFWCTGEGGGTMFITLNDSSLNTKILDFPFNIYAVDSSQTGGK